MINKVTFYCYLFCKPYNQVDRYDILWKQGDRYLLKQTQLDSNFKNPTQHVDVAIHSSLSGAIGNIFIGLRNHEIEHGVYDTLHKSNVLCECYKPLIDRIGRYVYEDNVKSFSVFGHVCKYPSQNTVRKYLQSLGCFILTTKPPHIWVLHDYIKIEQQEFHHLM